MKEKNFQTEFMRRNKITGVFELKFCNLSKTKRMRFDSLKCHQLDALCRANGPHGFWWKITDNPIYPGKRTRFHTKKPFDCFRISGVQAYVVVMFWIARKKKTVYYITPYDYVKMSQESDKKSYSEEMANVHAAIIEDWRK